LNKLRRHFVNNTETILGESEEGIGAWKFEGLMKWRYKRRNLKETKSQILNLELLKRKEEV
jgi:hypothetical protein